MRRYQLYYRLVDISFWITAFWLLAKIIGAFVPEIPYFWDAFAAIYTVLYPFNILLAIFLALARFMRDELAERIWQITARRFVNFMIIGPLLVSLLATVFSSEFFASAPDIIHPKLVEILERTDNAGLHFMYGIIATLFIMAQLIPILYVLFYRWGLWRNSR